MTPGKDSVEDREAFASVGPKQSDRARATPGIECGELGPGLIVRRLSLEDCRTTIGQRHGSDVGLRETVEWRVNGETAVTRKGGDPGGGGLQPCSARIAMDADDLRGEGWRDLDHPAVGMVRAER